DLRYRLRHSLNQGPSASVDRSTTQIMRLEIDRLIEQISQWRLETTQFLASPYLVVSSTARERVFSSALSLLRTHLNEITAIETELPQLYRQMVVQRRKRYLRRIAAIAIFIGPILLAWGLFQLPLTDLFVPSQKGTVEDKEVLPTLQDETIPDHDADTTQIRRSTENGGEAVERPE
ncbi:MAG: hypothetical protein KAU50_03235, partial [Candidatus Marinimicrobia bacterium]|nr:hypothetical protein [Candidatus Neomarinimicrobiota bacterium]